MADLPTLFIVGAGGFGREIAALVETINADTPTWNLAGFVDDDATLHDEMIMGYPVHGGIDWLARQEHPHFVLAIGDSCIRQDIAERLARTNLQPVTLTPPSTSLHRTAEIAPGTLLCQGVETTVHVRIGSHSILNLNCTVGHDSVLEEFVTLHPGVHISGNSTLKTGVSMGTGAVVLPDVQIGAHTTVGAGAVVTEDLPPDCTAVGVPARPQS